MLCMKKNFNSKVLRRKQYYFISAFPFFRVLKCNVLYITINYFHPVIPEIVKRDKHIGVHFILSTCANLAQSSKFRDEGCHGYKFRTTILRS